MNEYARAWELVLTSIPKHAGFPITIHLSRMPTPTPSRPALCLGILLLFPQVGANGRLVETVTLVQELGDVLDIRSQQLVLNEILDALEMTEFMRSPHSIGPPGGGGEGGGGPGVWTPHSLFWDGVLKLSLGGGELPISGGVLRELSEATLPGVPPAWHALTNTSCGCWKSQF